MRYDPEFGQGRGERRQRSLWRPLALLFIFLGAYSVLMSLLR